jgi:hypothetical protein
MNRMPRRHRFPPPEFSDSQSTHSSAVSRRPCDNPAMQCLGRTQAFQRCRKATRRLVCHTHRFQPWIALLTVVTTAAALFGLSRDIVEPWQRRSPAAKPESRSPSQGPIVLKQLPRPVESQEQFTNPVLPDAAPSVRVAPQPADIVDVGGATTKGDATRSITELGQLAVPQTIKQAVEDERRPYHHASLADARLLLSAVGDGTALLELIVDNPSEGVVSIKRIRIESQRPSTSSLCFNAQSYAQMLILAWPMVTESALIDGWTVLGHDCVDVTGVLSIGCGAIDQFDLGVPVQVDLTPQARKRVTLTIKFVDLDEESLQEVARLSDLSPNTIAVSLFYAWPQMRVRLEIAGRDPSNWVSVEKEGFGNGLTLR